MEDRIRLSIRENGSVNNEENESFLAHSETFDAQTLETSKESSLNRLESVDALRGFAIWVMILVNNSGNSYSVLMHSYWNGLTLADFVMPFFLFIVGISVILSTRSMLKKQVKKSDILKKGLVRTLKLFLLGLLLSNGWPLINLNYFRFLGVLQRIAFCYIFVLLVTLYIPVNNRFQTSQFHILVSYLGYWIVAACMMFIYLFLMYGWNVPGCGRGQVGTTCNAPQYIDSQVLTPNHMYGNPTCLKSDPPCPYFDPEGILTTIGAVTSTFFGVYYALIIEYYTDTPSRYLRWIPLSVTLIIIGLILDYTGAIPFNKNLYSLSYIVFMAGCSGAMLCVCYFIIDIQKFDLPLRPFIWLGMNSIFIYVGSEAFLYFPLYQLIWNNETLYDLLFDPINSPLKKFFWAFSFANFWVAVAYFLYKRKIFIKL